jgi:hypothetical protein
MHYLRLLLLCAATLLLLNLVAPYVIARSLTAGEHIALAGLLLACAAAIHKARASRRRAKLEEMRDSALW